jgi:hypothetical protein
MNDENLHRGGAKILTNFCVEKEKKMFYALEQQLRHQGRNWAQNDGYLQHKIGPGRSMIDRVEQTRHAVGDRKISGQFLSVELRDAIGAPQSRKQSTIW